MSNFMGPMAPPPAAQPQPQALDFKTDPNQRQRFRQFMRERVGSGPAQAPAAMPNGISTTMPPLLPEVDIFNPQGYAAGGIVGGLENLGTMSKKMIDHLNNAVYGGASGASVNYSDSGMSSAPQNRLGGDLLPPPIQPKGMQDQNTHSALTAQFGPLSPNAAQPMREFGAYGFAPNIQEEMSPDSPYFNVPDISQMQPLVGFNENNPYQMQPLGSSNANNQNLMLSQGVLGIPDAAPLVQGTNMRSIFGFEDGGSVSDALADALSNDIGDYSFDDTFTDLSQTSYNDFDPGGNESFDAAAMDQFRNQQKSDLSDIIGQQIQSSIKSNQQMGTPAPVPQSAIEQMQFENLQNVPSTEPVFSAPSFNLGGQSASFDLLGNPLTIGFKDGGSVPPREANIRGQYHELSYITPDEADILEALGGTGEAGPMGIPAFAEDDGDNDVGGSVGGGIGGDDVGTAGGPSGGDDSDNASDDEMGDVGVMDGPSSPSNDDDLSDSTEVAQDQQNMGFDVFDSIDDFNQQQQEQAKDRAIRAAFVTDISGKPIGARSGYVTQGAASDATKAAGYQALGLPDPNSDLASADVEASYGVPANSINSVSATPPGTTNKTDLLGFNYDLLKSNIDKAIEAAKGIPTQASPLIGSPFAAGVTSSGINAAKDRLSARTGSNTSAPSSNVVSDFSPTPADQLADVYGIDLDVLNAAVDDDFASIGNRLGAGVEGVGTGYTDQGLPVGLEFATNPQTGAQITTNLAGLTEQQKANQPLSMDIAQFMGSSPYGYEIDPATGNPIGQVGTAPFGTLGGLTTLAQDLIMGQPQTTQDLIDRGAYTGMTGQNNDDDIFGGGRDDDDILPPDDTEEEVAPPPIVQMPGFFGPPSAPTEPVPVLVPSTRTSALFSGQMPVGYGSSQTGQISPYALSEMQRYEDILRQLSKPKSPIGLANGGSVLDAAAGKFLESLTAA